jgi:hypothetical protein
LIGGKKKLSLIQKVLNQNRVMDFNATKLQDNFLSVFKISYRFALKHPKTVSTFFDHRNLVFPLLANRLLID